nr:type II toxin-antitoxin system RelE/ParE family toxin [Brevundimonas diminuta]
MTTNAKWAFKWTQNASDDRFELSRYYEIVSQEAAISLNEDIEDAVEMLRRFPHSARPDRDGVRTKVIRGGKVKIFYFADDAQKLIMILNVVSSSRQFPN